MQKQLEKEHFLPNHFQNGVAWQIFWGNFFAFIQDKTALCYLQRVQTEQALSYFQGIQTGRALFYLS